jgi:hypothetical protein
MPSAGARSRRLGDTMLCELKYRVPCRGQRLSVYCIRVVKVKQGSTCGVWLLPVSYPSVMRLADFFASVIGDATVDLGVAPPSPSTAWGTGT